jgi:SAM-dependent methyltransferase
MSGFHLPPRYYDILQVLAHKRHYGTYRVITRLLQLDPGDTIVEVGCGTGLLAKHFVSGGFDYWGFDPDEDRINYAKQRNPQAHFIVGDTDSLEQLNIPHFRHTFIHGVLHHLPDRMCHSILESLFNYRSDLRLVISEPYIPNPWWANPIGALFARFDEGKFMRSRYDWLDMFAEYADLVEFRSLWPTWPVPFLDARLFFRQN